MRVVVIAPYPPTVDGRGDAVLADVRARRADGQDVDVVSPDPSAARHHARPDTYLGAVRIGRVVRGADLAVVYSFVPRRGIARLGARRALARALARARRVEFVADIAIPATDLVHRRAARELARRVRAGAPTFARTIGERVAHRR